MSFSEMLDIDWNELEGASASQSKAHIKTKEEKKQRIRQIQTETVESGRSEDTRFDRFCEYAGHQIRQARFGHQTEQEALDSVKLWVKDKMNPPWDEDRINSSFNGILQKDKVQHQETWAERDKPRITMNEPICDISQNSQNSQNSYGWEEPEPLVEKIKYEEYPIESFPLVMQQAAQEYQGYAQVPMAMVGGILLASASLAVQGLVNVRRDSALCGPVTLNVITVADTGERKTSADRAMATGAREWEAEAQNKWKQSYRAFHSEASLHEKKVKKTEKNILNQAPDKENSGINNLESQLSELMSNAPKQPIKPVLFYMDVTIEALISELATGFPVASLWTDEAGILVGGHSLRESALASFAIFNTLWDGRDYKVNRKTTGNAEVKGRRLSLNLSMQADVFNRLTGLEGGKSRSTGWLARSLVSYPPSTIGTRIFKEGKPMQAVKEFNTVIKKLLDLLPDFENVQDAELDLQEIGMSVKAKEVWVEYANNCEKKQHNFGEYAALRDFASKSAEQAARIAAVFQVIESQDIHQEISYENMERATTLAQWYLNEVMRTLSELLIPEAIKDAKKMLDWLVQKKEEKGQRSFTMTEISQYGPHSLRKKKKRNECIRILAQHNYVAIIPRSKKSLVIVLNPLAKAE